MDETVTRRDLAATEERLIGRMTEMEERLRGSQTEMEERLIGRVDAQIEGLRGSQAEMEERLVERMRDMQTEIIGAFIQVQARNESRDSTLEETTATLNKRLGLVESRLTQIEMKLLMEPPAA